MRPSSGSVAPKPNRPHCSNPRPIRNPASRGRGPRMRPCNCRASDQAWRLAPFLRKALPARRRVRLARRPPQAALRLGARSMAPERVVRRAPGQMQRTPTRSAQRQNCPQSRRETTSWAYTPLDDNSATVSPLSWHIPWHSVQCLFTIVAAGGASRPALAARALPCLADAAPYSAPRHNRGTLVT